MEWYKSYLAFDCSQCKKTIKPGRKIGLDKGLLYCFRCGHRLELSNMHRSLSWEVRAIQHLKSIKATYYREQEANPATERLLSVK